MRFAIFLTGDSSPYTRNHYGTYADLFERFLKQATDKWDIFDSRKQEYPEDLAQYHVVLLTGSAADAHAREPWILRLEQEIRRVFEYHLPMIGFCFGHQAIANALGGKSGRNPAGWEVGLFPLSLTPAFQQQPFTRDIKALNILEIHQDHVIAVPPGAQVLASTPATPVQIYSIGNRVLCFQGHPEFENDIVAELIESRMLSGVIEKTRGSLALSSMNERQQDQALLRQMVNRFLGRD